MGLSTTTDSGTLLPFSAITGRSIVMRPAVAVLPEENFAISALACGGSADALRRPSSMPVPTPRAVARASRRVIVCVLLALRLRDIAIHRLMLVSDANDSADRGKPGVSRDNVPACGIVTAATLLSNP